MHAYARKHVVWLVPAITCMSAELLDLIWPCLLMIADLALLGFRKKRQFLTVEAQPRPFSALQSFCGEYNLGRGRAGAPEAPALDLVLTMRLLCFQRHVSVGVCSNACMRVGVGQLGAHSACMFWFFQFFSRLRRCA
jgi:hypothetical protein